MVNLSMVNNTKDYKCLLSRDREYGRSVQLTCISCLFFNYLMHTECTKYLSYCQILTGTNNLNLIHRQSQNHYKKLC